MNKEQQELLQQLVQMGDVTHIKKTRGSLVNAISEMNSAALELILDDEVSYQDTTKSIFLEKLNEIFHQFKKKDTTLIAYEGKCSSKECTNINRAGFSFVGNNSGNYLNLVIEQNDHGGIENICNCHQFCIQKDVWESLNAESIIRIYEDEKIDFYPDAEYISIKNECIAAINELKREKGLSSEVLIRSQEIIDWINKYQPLYDSFELPPLFFKEEDTFYWIYSDIKKIGEFLDLEDEAAAALAEFKHINPSVEIELLRWLVNYEHFYYDLILLHPDTISEKGIETGREKLKEGLDTYFNTDILKNCITMEAILDQYYYEMLTKYTTLTAKEQDNLLPFDDSYAKMSSLKFHLEKRGIV